MGPSCFLELHWLPLGARTRDAPLRIPLPYVVVKTRQATAASAAPAQAALWKIRTPEEAAQFWDAEFGHLKPGHGPPSEQAEHDRTETLY